MNALLLAIALFWAGCLAAEPIRLAVASNFLPTAKVLTAAYESKHEQTFLISSGSTGHFYAQIVAGAPYDAFLAADARRPARLAREGHTLKASRFTYALGRLALWRQAREEEPPSLASLAAEDYRHLTIANPRLAPYGEAAQQALTQADLWKHCESRLVYGQNILQARQLAVSGRAEYALLSWSQVLELEQQKRGRYRLLPAELHEPIRQQAVQLQASEATANFLRWLRGEEARAIIAAAGYELP